MAGTSLQIINTEAVPLAHRKELWLSHVIPGAAKVTGTPSGKRVLHIESMESFRGEWQYADLGFLRYSLMKCTPHTLHFDLAGPRVQAFFQLGGITHIPKGTREVALTPGTWAIHKWTESMQLIHRTPVEYIVLAMDKHPFDLEGVEGLHAFTAKQGLHKLIYEFVCDTFSTLPALSRAGDGIAEITGRLLRQAIAEADSDGSVISESGKQIRVDGIKRFIEQYIGDALLSPEQIAAHFYCSKRTLHRAFAIDGESMERYIWRRRIECCAQELSSVDTLSLTDLAYSYGFNSSTHFSRLFKTRYGMTPTEFMQLQRKKKAAPDR